MAIATEVKHALPSLKSAAWLAAEPTQRLLASLNGRGHTARVVGGAVRNALLGRAVADIDIATTATPEQVIAATEADGLKTVPTGLKHGTVTVIAHGHPFEVTTLRHDVDTDGRHATVAFTDDWAADASRRDLTLNALYCDADGTIFDPLGGLDDVLARRVRFIGDAHQRIREDYLRILRFFRFTAQYADGAPDATGLDATVAERDGLARLSAERVRAELVRLLAAPRAVPVIHAMAAYGMLTAILSVAPRLGVFERLAAIENALGLVSDARLRLAALAIAVDEDAVRLAQHLRLSSDERNVLVLAGGLGTISPALDTRALHGALYRLGEDRYRQRVLLDWARCGAPAAADAWRQILALPARWPVPKLPFSGRDLIARGAAPGPRLGEMLTAFEAWWIAQDFPDDRALLEAELDRLIGRAR